MESVTEADEKEPPLSAPLWFRNEVTKELFADESEEVKDEVERHRNEDEEEDDLGSDCDDADAARVAKAWTYHR